MNFPKIILHFILYSGLLSGLFFHANVSAEAEIKNLEKIRAVIAQRIEGVGEYKIQPSPIKGLYLVIAPPRILYISEDANYIFEGDVTNINTGEDLTRGYRNSARYAAVETMKDSMIIFSPPKDKIKHTITVFTDIDCYYCKKLHSEVDEFNRLGIQVRYLAYPRQGAGSAAYAKAITVWCSKDKQMALTRAKNGVDLKAIKCDNPVDKHFALGDLLGVRGTPAIFLENGQMYPGYIPAARLSQALDKAKKAGAFK
ncbi:Thiol:disulfide interchange protein DsbC [hydrothermal vent metagenome]|uniref:Thiol:disulfide interchange protein DsbC n=1 Tax=hydrothermal vent metagenome TaxID=652676 RepID=A0A3B1A1K0_9ZZZZ